MKLLLKPMVWLRAVTQIFYSLGVGFGSLIAFASYSSKDNNFVRDARNVSLINCGTSIFAGFVVFPILGYLATELGDTNPCIRPDDIRDLESIGLQGTGLAFIAFPIAISKMPGAFLWAMLFFLMLFCLGVDSQFAMVESIMTVVSDTSLGKHFEGRKPLQAFLLCFALYLLGIIFMMQS